VPYGRVYAGMQSLQSLSPSCMQLRSIDRCPGCYRTVCDCGICLMDRPCRIPIITVGRRVCYILVDRQYNYRVTFNCGSLARHRDTQQKQLFSYIVHLLKHFATADPISCAAAYFVLLPRTNCNLSVNKTPITG